MEAARPWRQRRSTQGAREADRGVRKPIRRPCGTHSPSQPAKTARSTADSPFTDASKDSDAGEWKGAPDRWPRAVGPVQATSALAVARSVLALVVLRVRRNRHASFSHGQSASPAHVVARSGSFPKIMQDRRGARSNLPPLWDLKMPGKHRKRSFSPLIDTAANRLSSPAEMIATHFAVHEAIG